MDGNWRLPLCREGALLRCTQKTKQYLQQLYKYELYVHRRQCSSSCICSSCRSMSYVWSSTSITEDKEPTHSAVLECKIRKATASNVKQKTTAVHFIVFHCAVKLCAVKLCTAQLIQNAAPNSRNINSVMFSLSPEMNVDLVWSGHTCL